MFNPRITFELIYSCCKHGCRVAHFFISSTSSLFDLICLAAVPENRDLYETFIHSGVIAPICAAAITLKSKAFTVRMFTSYQHTCQHILLVPHSCGMTCHGAFRWVSRHAASTTCLICCCTAQPHLRCIYAHSDLKKHSLLCSFTGSIASCTDYQR